MRSHDLAHQLLALPDLDVVVDYDDASRETFGEEGIGAWDVGTAEPTGAALRRSQDAVVITISDRGE